MDAHVSTRVYAHPLAVAGFLLLTFAITWGFWMPSALADAQQPVLPIEPGLYGPSVAAILVILVTQGKRAIGLLFRALLLWRVSWVWYVLVFGIPGALAIVAWLGDWIITGQPATFADAPIYGALAEDFATLPLFASVLVVFFGTLIGAPLGEEIGWRGYALSRFQGWMSPLLAGIVLGAIWGIWHLPLFWMEFMAHADYPIAAFMVNIVLASVIFTWMFNATGGSLLLAVLFHTAQNVVSGFAPVSHHISWVSAGAAFILVLALLFSNQLRRPGAHEKPQ